jgi:hypothetical protein
MPGAFRESLSLRGTRGVKLLFQHDPNEPIGVWLELNEDTKGLFARRELARGRDSVRRGSSRWGLGGCRLRPARGAGVPRDHRALPSGCDAGHAFPSWHADLPHPRGDRRGRAQALAPMSLRGARPVTGVSVRGLQSLRRRLEARGLPNAVRETLRREADLVAEEAARNAPGNFGATVEVRDASQGDRAAFAVGTAHRAGRFLEFGTVRQRASPWLYPALAARLPRIKQSLRKILAASYERPRRDV